MLNTLSYINTTIISTTKGYINITLAYLTICYLIDRKLFHQILLQESKQIEKALIKQKQAQQLMLEDEKAQFHLLLEQCKDRFLFYDEDMYLQCLEKL